MKKKSYSQLFPHTKNHIIKPMQINNKLLIIRHILEITQYKKEIIFYIPYLRIFL